MEEPAAVSDSCGPEEEEEQEEQGEEEEEVKLRLDGGAGAGGAGLWWLVSKSFNGDNGGLCPEQLTEVLLHPPHRWREALDLLLLHLLLLRPGSSRPLLLEHLLVGRRRGAEGPARLNPRLR